MVLRIRSTRSAYIDHFNNYWTHNIVGFHAYIGCVLLAGDLFGHSSFFYLMYKKGGMILERSTGYDPCIISYPNQIPISSELLHVGLSASYFQRLIPHHFYMWKINGCLAQTGYQRYVMRSNTPSSSASSYVSRCPEPPPPLPLQTYLLKLMKKTHIHDLSVHPHFIR